MRPPVPATLRRVVMEVVVVAAGARAAEVGDLSASFTVRLVRGARGEGRRDRPRGQAQAGMSRCVSWDHGGLRGHVDGCILR